MGEKGIGNEVGGDKGQNKEQVDTMVEFRVAMTSTCTHKGLIFHYKA